MKKWMCFLLSGFLTLLFALPVLAEPQREAAQTNSDNEQIFIYSAPQAGNILEKIPANVPLVPIYRENDWIKVGDPRNGQIGWVNRNQMHQAREAFFRPDIQTIYIHEERTVNGKPQLNIVAYKNGKELSPEQAQRLYERMRQNQLREIARMRHMTRWMEEQIVGMRPAFEPLRVLPPLPSSSNMTNTQQNAQQATHNPSGSPSLKNSSL